MRRGSLVALCTLVVATTACARKRVARLTDPASAHRFEIVRAADTTFRFLVAGAPWVRRGSAGLVVDPRRRDVLIARYVVFARSADTADAVVTGQMARVATDHVALLELPRAGFWRQRAFWVGLFGGGAVGAATAVAAR